MTSALTDEGRTFLARELALSFARAGGQTLLVDFDLRMPTLHEPFEVANEVGFCELLTGEADLPSAAKILPFGIALLTAGTVGGRGPSVSVGGQDRGRAWPNCGRGSTS